MGAFLVEGGPDRPVRFWRPRGSLGRPGGCELAYLRAQENVERLGEEAGEFSVVLNDDLLEDCLVELAADPVGGRPVHGLGVCCECERGFELGVDEVVLVGGFGESLLDVGERIADAALFALEEVERDRLGVVGLEEFLALVEEPALPLAKRRLLGRRLFAEKDEFLPEQLFEQIAFVGAELVDRVVVDDLVLDLVDEDGLESATAALVVTAGADEVGVDAA